MTSDDISAHPAEARRIAAARIASEFREAADLDQLMDTAMIGFQTLFEGRVVMRLMGPTPEMVIDGNGPVDLLDLPDPVRQYLCDGEAQTEVKAHPLNGVLLAPSPNPQFGCRTWVEFDATREVTTDELIVGDLLAAALDLAIERILAEESFAERQVHLQRAVESHRFVGQAIGILVERHRIKPSEAFARLRTASQSRNIKLHDIAARVVDTGLDPERA